MEERKEESFDIKAVLLYPKCPAVKHSFPLPGLDFKSFPDSWTQQ